MDNYFDSLKSLHVITYAHRTYKIIAVCFACASYSEFIDLILHCLMFHSLNYFYLYRQTYSNISQQHRELLFNMNRSKGCFRVLSWTSRPADDQSLSDLLVVDRRQLHTQLMRLTMRYYLEIIKTNDYLRCTLSISYELLF